MLQLLLLLGGQGLYVVLVGGGIAGYIAGANAWTFERFFWAGLSTLAFSCVGWSFALGVGGGLAVAFFVSGVGALGGWGIYRRTFNRNSNEVSTRQFKSRGIGVGLALLAICALATLPAVKNWTSLSTSVRIGPDSIGNAVAASALSNNVTLKEIRNDVIEGTNSTSLAEVLKFETHKLYTVLDLRTQIRTEFLVAGLRWGLPGFSAQFLRLTGQENVWAILPALGAFSLLVAMVGAYLVGLRLTRRRYVAVAFAIVTCVNATLLNGWHEGGISQVWAFPAIFGVVLAVLDQEKTFVQRVIMATLSFALALVGYSDLWILLFAIVLLSIVISVIMKVRDWSDSGGPLVVGVFLSMVVCIPYTMRFVPYVLRRFTDASIGGWSMPVWMSPSELLGIVNAYSQLAPSGLQIRSDAMTLFQFAVNPIFIVLAVVILVSRRKQYAKYLSVSAGLILVAIYFKTRYIDHVTNYQYFKAAGLSIPLLWLCILLPSKQTAARVRESVVTSLVVVISSVFVLASTFAYVVEFRDQAQFLDGIRPNGLMNESDQRFFASSNFVASPTLTLVAISSVVQLNLYGRGAFEKFEGTMRDALRPLYLLVVAADCSAWSCLRSVNPKDVRELSNDLKAVRLAEDSMEVYNLRDSSDLLDELSSLSSRLFTNVGGFGLASFHPLSDPVQ